MDDRAWDVGRSDMVQEGSRELGHFFRCYVSELPGTIISESRGFVDSLSSFAGPLVLGYEAKWNGEMGFRSVYNFRIKVGGKKPHLVAKADPQQVSQIQSLVNSNTLHSHSQAGSWEALPLGTSGGEVPKAAMYMGFRVRKTNHKEASSAKPRMSEQNGEKHREKNIWRFYQSIRGLDDYLSSKRAHMCYSWKPCLFQVGDCITIFSFCMGKGTAVQDHCLQIYCLL